MIKLYMTEQEGNLLFTEKPGVYPNYVEFTREQYDDFTLNFELYTFVDGKLIKDDSREQPQKDEMILAGLRIKRQKAFDIINRGTVWYKTLDESQLTELNKWYQDWLNVTETKIEPIKPTWLE